MREVAREVGISATYLSRVETGQEKSLLSRQRLLELAKCLDVAPRVLLEAAARARGVVALSLDGAPSKAALALGLSLAWDTLPAEVVRQMARLLPGGEGTKP